MPLLRRNVRFPIPDSLGVEASLEGTNGKRFPTRAAVRAIGPAGVQLFSLEPVPLFSDFICRIDHATTNIHLEAAAYALLTKINDQPGFLVDCRFHEEVPGAAFEGLAASTKSDAREHPRFAVSARGAIAWEMQGERIPVVVEDLSRGGFRLTAPSAGTMRARLLLFLPDAAEGTPPILASLCWQMPGPDGWRLGCEFLDEKGYFTLQDHCRTPEEPRPKERRPWRESLWLSAVGAACLVGVMGWLVWH